MGEYDEDEDDREDNFNEDGRDDNDSIDGY